MRTPVQSNYDVMRDLMEEKFLKYNQLEMIRKFSLIHDEQYLYLRFVGKMYRVSRLTGRVESCVLGSAACEHADYNVSMTIFDVLCCSRPDCHLAGKFVTVNNLKNIMSSAKTGSGLFTGQARFFANRGTQLRKACEKLGGISQAVGDVSYELLLFDFLPVTLQFWDADDEFEAELKILWDENILDYMHYETTYFAASHLLKRLRELSG